SLTSSLTCESSVAGVPVPAAASWALVRRRLLVVLGGIGLFPPRLTGGPPPRTVYRDSRCHNGGGACGRPPPRMTTFSRSGSEMLERRSGSARPWEQYR